jgi:hypothetical protein
MSLVTPDHSLVASLDALGPLVARTAVAAAGLAPRDATGRRVLVVTAESGGGG